MEFLKIEPYIVYVKIDSNGYITDINSSAFLPDTKGWMEIDSGYGDKYHHAQGNYFPEFILTDSNVWRYKLVDGVAVECSAEEIVEQEKVLPKPETEKTVWDELDAAYREGVNSI